MMRLNQKTVEELNLHAVKEHRFKHSIIGVHVEEVTRATRPVGKIGVDRSRRCICHTLERYRKNTASIESL